MKFHFRVSVINKHLRKSHDEKIPKIKEVILVGGFWEIEVFKKTQRNNDYLTPNSKYQ
ncbi:hypothetical protein [Candidatus Nitrosocosmicus sp. SS]|uniref:hypothetical protein n=1 Tax=Candidatus Nitrosocosmicus agrestis TaxID=2563600 RepID=UPI0012B51AFC|nr:hypothetical protein [Candidatus Nitrosocosmicus sp. SS]